VPQFDHIDLESPLEPLLGRKTAEVLEAQLFTVDALPAGMPRLHRELARRR